MRRAVWIVWLVGCNGAPVDPVGAADAGGDEPAVETAPEGVTVPPFVEACPVDTVCAWAGLGINGFNGDGPRLGAWMSYPLDLAFSGDGTPTIVDWNNHRLRTIDGDGVLDTVIDAPDVVRVAILPDGTLIASAGFQLLALDAGVLVPLAGSGRGNIDGDLADARFDALSGLTVDAAGNVYVVDQGNDSVRFVDLVAGTVDTVVSELGLRPIAHPQHGGAVALSPDGTKLYVAATDVHSILRVDLATGAVETWAGAAGQAGDIDGDRLTARFAAPLDLEMSPDGLLFVADGDNHEVRVIDTATGEVSTYVGTGEPTCEISGDVVIPQVCEGQTAEHDGLHRLETTLYRPFGVALDPDGDLVIADAYNHRLRVVGR